MKYLGIEFKYDLNKKEKKFIKCLVDNGYEISNIKQYNTKMKLDLTKDGITIPYDFVKEVEDVESYCKMINRSFDLTKFFREREKN